MKNKKKTPKTLSKFAPGGTTNFNEFGDPNQNSGTQNIYNKGRNSKINAGQYAGLASTIGAGASQMAMNNNSLQGEEKTYANNQVMQNTADGVITQMPGFGQYYGVMKGASDLGKSMLAKDQYGNYKTGVDKASNEIMTADHSAMINDIFNKNYTALGLDSMGVGKFARMFSDVTGNSQKTDGGWGKFNKFVGITPDKKEFPNGGISMQPNAEIEKQENAVTPNGGFLQADGPTHAGGGVPVSLPGNTMIFSDRLKPQGLKKTFAQLNKMNNTNKEDKILDSDKHSSLSKRTAELMRFVKNKNSEKLFNEQESLKQTKVQAYAKRMGVSLDNENQEYPMGGVKLPMYPLGGNGNQIVNNPAITSTIGQDPIYYTYQGNQVMKPNLNAYNKDKGVATDIGLNNYNNLLNTRTQVRDSNVNVGKKLPKFEYINDPSKGDYNTQFENYRKVNVGYFANGGRLPKYKLGDLTPEEDVNVESSWNNSSNKIDALKGWNSHNGKNINEELYNQELTKMSNTGSKEDNSNKFDWKRLGTQAAYFAANNAGNIYNLSRYNKPEVEQYQRMQATYLDPTAAIRDANDQTRRAEYNVRGASSGNAGTYLSNRVGLNTQNIINKDRIRQEYANANAGIANSVGQYNNELARQEVIANAQNRARTRSGKGEAIGSMGYNTANQMTDNRKTNMDQETLGLLMKYYDTPEFQRIMKEYKSKK